MFKHLFLFLILITLFYGQTSCMQRQDSKKLNLTHQVNNHHARQRLNLCKDLLKLLAHEQFRIPSTQINTWVNGLSMFENISGTDSAEFNKFLLAICQNELVKLIRTSCVINAVAKLNHYLPQQP